MTLEDRFNRAMEEAYYRAGREAGYWANYFIRDLRQKGGLASAKSLLRLCAGSTLHAGLQALVDAGMTHISVECLVLSEQFRGLFTQEERPKRSADWLRYQATPSGAARMLRVSVTRSARAFIGAPRQPGKGRRGAWSNRDPARS